MQLNKKSYTQFMSTLFRFWQVLKGMPEYYFEERRIQKEINRKGLKKFIEDEEKEAKQKATLVDAK